MLIYKVVNRIDDLLYIGQTVNLHKRWLKHQDEARHGSDRPLYRAMRTYGIENFWPETIEECPNYRTLKSRETYWIRILNTVYPQGYNARAPQFTNTEAAIIKYDAWGWTLDEYSLYFRVSIATLKQLQYGMSHFNITREDLPQIETSFPIHPKLS